MALITGLLGLLAGALLGALYAHRVLQGARQEVESWRSKHDAELVERARLASDAARVPALEERIAALLAEVSQVRADHAQGQARLEEQARSHEKEIATLKDLRSGIDEELKKLSAEALRSNQTAFLELANQTFEKHKVGAEAELTARQSECALPN